MENEILSSQNSSMFVPEGRKAKSLEQEKQQAYLSRLYFCWMGIWRDARRNQTAFMTLEVFSLDDRKLITSRDLVS